MEMSKRFRWQKYCAFGTQYVEPDVNILLLLYSQQGDRNRRQSGIRTVLLIILTVMATNVSFVGWKFDYAFKSE